MTVTEPRDQASQFRTHGPAGAGGLESFLRAAESTSLYGRVEIIGGEIQTQFDMAAGRIVLDGGTTREDQTEAFTRMRQILNLVNASTTGAYRCGPLLNRDRADALTTVAISDLLGPDRRRSVSAEAPTQPTESLPAESLSAPTPPAPIPLPVRQVTHAPNPAASATAAPNAPSAAAPAAANHLPPQSRVPTPAAPPSTSVGSSPLAGIRPEARSSDTRPLRASQIRRILDSLDEAEAASSSTAPEGPEAAPPEPNRRSALRSIIRSLASQ